MRHLLFTVIALASTVAMSAEGTGAWSFADDQGSLTIHLMSDGTCLISAFHKASGRGERVECTYWLHGSRVRVRVPGQRDGEGYNRLDIEHDPASNSLIVHGEKPRTLKRQLPGQS